MPIEITPHHRITAPKKSLQGVLFVLGGCFLAIVALRSPVFAVPSNLMNVLKQVAVPGIVAAGMAFVVIAGGFDLSVGALAALAGVLAIGLSSHGLLVSLIVPILTGMGFGAMNGLLICRAAIHPLIVTLGIRYVVYAAATLYTSGFIQVNREPKFLFFGRAVIARVPVSALIFFAIIAAGHLLLKRTVVGSAIYAIGNNERAAFYCGIRTESFRIFTYILSGICAALAGIVLASRSGAAAPDAGQGYELEAIAAVAVGGVGLLGGTGSMLNVLLGVFIFGLLNNLLILGKQPYEIHRIVVGGMIVLSLAVDFHLRKRTWR